MDKEFFEHISSKPITREFIENISAKLNLVNDSLDKINNEISELKPDSSAIGYIKGTLHSGADNAFHITSELSELCDNIKRRLGDPEEMKKYFQ